MTEDQMGDGELVELHRRALQWTRGMVAGIGGGQWTLPTPCEDWNVRRLLTHVVSGNFWAGELMAGKTIDEVGDRLDGDVLGDDPLGAYERSAKIAGDAFAGPGALDLPAAVSYGPVPGRVYAGHRFIDVLIHGWDLAKATDQDTTIDPELVDGCLRVIAPQADLLRGSGAFDASVEVPADADPQTELLALVGRRP